MYHAKWKKSISKGYLLHNSIYLMTFWKKQMVGQPPCIFAWESPWTEEPGRLQPMGSQRVRNDSATKQQQISDLGNRAARLSGYQGL